MIKAELPDFWEKFSIIQCFERIAHRYPDATALVYKDLKVSYSYLDSLSEKIARSLLKRGVHPEEPVALCLDRDIYLIAAMLGVMKAGAAYLPMEPSWPMNRKMQIVDDANLRFCIIGSKPELSSPILQNISLESIFEDSVEDTGFIDFPEVSTNQLAYILYTSGTTGKPKGVMVEHASVLNYINAYQKLAPISLPFNGSCICPVVFDVSVWEIFSVLCCGGCLHLLSTEHILNVSSFVSYFHNNKIQSAYLSPGMLSDLGDAFSLQKAQFSLSRILVGVESILQGTLQKFRDLSAQLHIINGYGPTEATISCTFYPFTSSKNDLVKTPIGKAIDAYRIYIVSSDLQLVKKGEKGEIVVGGKGLARGYFKDDELTRQRFFISSIPGCEGERLYRTGDMGWEMPDGNIQFEGRIDNQLKIRGYRIEPGDIEAAILLDGNTKACYVGSIPDASGSLILAAWLVSESTEDFLRSFLSERLPSYMVPQRFIFLDLIPRTSSGKIDKEKLPKPIVDEIIVDEDFTSDLEFQLGNIWKEVFKLNSIHRNDNFFEMGGHSIKAAQISARISNYYHKIVHPGFVFEYPTIAAMAAALALLPSSKIGMQMIRKSGEAVPLSYNQQRPWIIDRLQGPNALYNIPLVLELKGVVLKPVFEEAIAVVFERHEALRTALIEVEGEPKQILRTSARPIIRYVNDCKSVEDIISAEISEPFRLDTAPLARITLCQLSEKHHILIFVIHHSVCDGWSFGIMLDEISRYYNLLFAGNKGIEFSPAGSYLTFTLRERAYFQLPENFDELKVWDEITENVPPLLSLGKSANRPTEFSFKGASLSFDFTEKETEIINTLSQKAGSSPFMVLTTALSVILKTYSNEEEFLLATMAANRQYQEDESIIGFYTNTLLIRIDLTEDPSLWELMERVRNSVLRSFRYQHHPYELVLEHLKPERNLSYNPLYQVMIIYQNMPIDLLHFNGILVSEMEFERTKAKIDLSITFDTLGGKLHGLIEYATDIFDRAMIEQMIQHLRIMLNHLAETPDLKMHELSLLTDDDKQKLAEWSCNPVQFGGDTDVIPMFEAMAGMYPQKTVLVSDDNNISYADFQSRVHSIAHFIDNNSKVKGKHFAVLCHRNVDTLASYFAILMTGNVFIPLDPSYPQQRLEDICSNASVHALLFTVPENLTIWDPSLRIYRTYDIVTSKLEYSYTKIKSSDPAYIIYTSGSSGKPKGVVINRGSLGNFVRSSIYNFDIQSSDRVLQFANLTFDTSIEEIFPTLCSGATLVFRNEEALSSFSGFLTWCDEQKITIMDLPTAFWHNLVVLMSDQSLNFYDALRLVIIGGEEARAQQVRLFLKLAKGKVRLFNTYGPTETTVVACYYEFKDDFEGDMVPIGKPMPNVVLAVVDAQGMLVLPGSTGELLVGGECLADRYLKLPDLTLSKFSQVFVHGKFQRMYRTGDLVQYMPDGNLVFLGRNDDQIKIRGFRVEPGEIESLLLRMEGITDARVLGMKNPSGQIVLIAYVVAGDEDMADTAMNFLQEHLPGYMMPLNIIVMDSFPTNSHGKVNIRAFPTPDFISKNSGANDELPRTSIQKRLAEICKEVLHISQIYLDDNFFDMGGNSILATLLMTRINYHFKIKFPLAVFFRWPSIRGMDDYLSSAQYEQPGFITPISKASEGHIIKASYTQRRIWFLDKLEGSNAAYNVPFAYRISGRPNIHLLEKSIQIIIKRHDIMRSYLVDKNSDPILKKSDDVGFTLNYVSLKDVNTDEQESELKLIIKEHSLYIFDLARAPLFKVDLVECSETRFYLLLNFHHIISDNWAVGVFIRELSETYEQLRLGNITDDAPAHLQYSDFSVWQQQRIDAGEFDNQLKYWLKHLKHAPGSIQLPLDRPRKSTQTFNGAEYKVRIPIEVEQNLIALARDNNTTLYNVLLTSWAVLLSRYTLQNELVIGCPVANRHHPGTQEMMGVFVNNLPLLLSIDRHVSFKQNLQRVSAHFIEALQNQDIPFDLIVSKLNIKRNINIHPVFQVMFNLLNAHNDTPDFHDCNVEYVDPGRFVSKFDLSLIMANMDGQLTAVFEYNTDLFMYRSIRNMASYYLQLLISVAQNPDTIAGNLKLLNKVEESEYLKQINPSPISLPEVCYPSLFEEIVSANKEKVAVRFKNKQLTYENLLSSARSFAAYLIDAGVKPGDTVGLWLSRSEMIPVAMIGTQLSAAKYVPLDPIYPKDRILFMIEDSELKLLITDDELKDKLPVNTIQVVNVNDAMKFESDGVHFPELKHHHQVYTIYTSGSTGKPKGVEIMHGGLVNFLLGMKNSPGISSEDILLAITTLSFDISVLEIYLPLIAGATLVIASQEEAMDAALLVNALQTSNATILQATPVTWRMLSFSKWEGNKNLKAICGGEALLKDLSNQLLAKCGEVWNVYGPTEITVWATAYKVKPSGLAEGTEPLGFPIQNTFLYVLEPGQTLAPKGLPGELFIGGAGVAKSYKDRPILSSQKFVKDVFREDESARMYATGDLVRMEADGNLSFLGRIDNQVKIRGFRIELGEIESVISAFDEVSQCVAIVREDMPNSKRIVAYLRMKDGFDVDRVEMRNQLIHLLPEYMIPSAFVVMEEFPLTPSGKINRNALPVPESDRDGIKAEFVAPVTNTEIKLAELWCEVLKIDKISLYDDFFALGGHSLLGVSLFAKVEHHLKKRLPLASLFTHSTLGQMATLIQDDNEEPDWGSLVRIKPFGSKIPLFLVHGAGLNVILYNSLVKHMSPEQPVYGLQAKGLNGKEEPLKTMEDIAAHYISEIRKEYPTGPLALAGFSLGGIIAFEMARQLNAYDEQVLFLGMFDTVAYTSDKHLSPIDRKIKRIRVLLNKIGFNFIAFIKEPGSEKTKLMGWKIKSLKRKIRSFIYRRKAKQAYITGDKEKLPSYVHRVHELNNLAGENYILKPSPLKVDLFKAMHQTFYIIDKKTYTWDKYALKGVRVHNVPGEHSTIFWPPYDEAFSKKLQAGVDEAIAEYLNKQESIDESLTDE